MNRKSAPPESEAPKAVKRTRVRLAGRISLEDAFCRLAYSCLSQIEANEAGVLLRDVEALHQMRVGVRRLRALLALYRGLLEPDAGLRGELAWLAASLGPARDWDVLAGSTLPLLAVNGRWEGWSTLREYAAKQSAKQHEALLVVLGSARYASVLAALRAWLEARPWRRHAHSEADPSSMRKRAPPSCRCWKLPSAACASAPAGWTPTMPMPVIACA